ncbi:MAG TPA: PEP-utilizing enzyme [Dehalococcoidia bacterium]|nr:PEP-utilizing enzyme [Dehalococcoidia bacterium]
MILSYNDAFEVVWADPQRAKESWVHDRLHAPWAMPPLTQALFVRIMAVAFDVPTVFVNNYAFMRDWGPPATTPEVEARGPIPIWNEDFEPAVRAHCAEIRSRDYDSMSAGDLVDLLPSLFDATGAAFRYTTIVIFAFMRPTAALIIYLESILGDEAGPLVARILQGFENATTTAGKALHGLVEQAAANPPIAEALKSGDLDAIVSMQGGKAFLSAVHDYTQRYGWRSDSWYMAHLPVWAEDDRHALGMIGRYLEDPSRSPGAAMTRTEAVREEALREIEARLSPEQLERFNELFEASKDHVAISEDRAFWQLEICGSVRPPMFALGRKLADQGAIEEPNDVFHLTLDQAREAAQDPAADFRDAVRASKAEMERVRSLTPPSFIGVPPSVTKAPPDLQAVMKHLRGYGVVPSDDALRINGVAASKGRVTARARVLFGLEESARLQPGEIIVCRTTAPPWTSLFSIAGAVVSDGGGLLSHTAICAREYGIPAVVATQVATKQIPDGALITVDGDKGIVLIES